MSLQSQPHQCEYPEGILTLPLKLKRLTCEISRQPATSVQDPAPEDVPGIVGGGLDLAGGITSAAGADEVGDALSAAGDAVDGSSSDEKKEKAPLRLRSPKGGKGGAAGATGSALELAGSITSAAGAGAVGEALSAAGEAVEGKKGGGKAAASKAAGGKAAGAKAANAKAAGGKD